MMDPSLLEILVCPATHQQLVLAEDAIVRDLNSRIARGEVVNRSGQKVTEGLDAGLIPKNDRKWLYPVREDIPVMLIDEAIVLSP